MNSDNPFFSETFTVLCYVFVEYICCKAAVVVIDVVLHCAVTCGFRLSPQ